MEKFLLQNIIISQKEKFFAKHSLVSRIVLEKEVKKILSKEIVFITGIRRSGKSSLLYLIYKYLSTRGNVPDENVLFINFEDERFINFTVRDFETLFQSYLEIENPQGKKFFFLDEIQNIKGWERWIARLYEFENVKIFITGSNASLTDSDISTVLTGRNRHIHNYTFSVPEYALLQKVELNSKTLHSESGIVKVNRLMNKYFETGGFPEALKTNDIEIIDQYFKDIIYRDVVARHKIRNIKEIKELAIYLITNTGNQNSYDKLRKIIGANNTSTIKNYISFLQEAFLIYALPLFDYSVKKQIYNPNKYYISDIGFYHAVGFRFSEDNGRLLENLVLLDLFRNSKEVYYWKSKKAYEVDFVVHEKKRITHAIQVCYHLSNENQEREIRSLIAAADELKPKEFLIITMNQNNTINTHNIKITVISYINWIVKNL